MVMLRLPSVDRGDLGLWVNIKGSEDGRILFLVSPALYTFAVVSSAELSIVVPRYQRDESPKEQGAMTTGTSSLGAAGVSPTI